MLLQHDMAEGIAALERTGTWDLVPLPHDVIAITCKWVYKVKTRSDGSLERYMLVAEFLLLVVAEFLLSSRENDTRSWGNFLVYFSQMPCQPEGLGIHIYRLLASQAYAKMLV